MRRIGVIAKNSLLIRTIVESLQEKTDCQVVALDESDLDPGEIPLNCYPLVLVDVGSVQQPVEVLLKNFCWKNLDTTVVVIAPVECLPEVEACRSYGIDEVFAQPTNEVQMQHLVFLLVQRLKSFELERRLQDRLRQEVNQSQIVAKSAAMRSIMQRLPRLAASNSTVLVSGETGTGKELMARALHYLGPHGSQPFITVDCAALPENLVENELFGHARGAYTGAESTCRGLLHEADGGTLFLDEVQALPVVVQAKFLRFLQERQYRPLGQAKYVSANVRVIAATNIELARAVEQKLFRADLFYRLNVLSLFLPPLRERKADIPGLAYHFIAKHANDSQPHSRLTETMLQQWLAYDWPGNVRELENRVQLWLTTVNETEPEETREFSAKLATGIRPLAEVRHEILSNSDKLYLQNLMRHTHGNLSAAARLAEIDRKNLRVLLRKYGIEARFFR